MDFKACWETLQAGMKSRQGPERDVCAWAGGVDTDWTAIPVVFTCHLHLHVLLPCKDLSSFLKNEDLTLNEANEALPNSSGVPPGLQAKALGSQLCSNDGILEIRLWEKNRIWHWFDLTSEIFVEYIYIYVS